MVCLGDVVPDFQADSTKGPIHFHDYINKYSILASVPAENTPVCTSEIGEAAKLQDEFKKRGVQLIFLVCNDIKSNEQWVKDIEGSLSDGRKIEFPIIADADRSVTSKYGMFDADEGNEDGKFSGRATFIIGPDKKLKLSMLYPASTGRSFQEILRAIDSLLIAEKFPVATPAEWKPDDEVMILPKVSEEEAKEKFPDHRVIQVKSGKAYVRKTKLPASPEE
jgi:1-Cys peroxiredoxin 6